MDSTSLKQITVEEVVHSIQNGDQVILLDVRTPGEFERGYIKNSVNIPLDDLQHKVESVIPYKITPIYVYCLSGARSDVAVTILSQLGYTNVYSVKSGLLAWRAKKYELVI